MKHAIIGAALALSLAVPALAKDKPPVFLVTSAVKDKPAVALDPKQAYILVRSDAAVPLHLMRDPSSEDQAAWEKLRSDALAKARTKYAKRLASWEKASAAAAKAPKGDPRAVVPEKPVEPTEENFEFTPFGLMTGVSIGPMNRFAKVEGGASTYLQAVTPGNYRLYGPVTVLPNAPAVGSCFCMGSVRFEAKAGEIVDMGTIVTRAAPAAAGERLVPLTLRIDPATAETPVDPRLKGTALRAAAYRPAGKLPNYFGLAIDRLPEMPGVFRYDRDRIVDLTGGN